MIHPTKPDETPVLMKLAEGTGVFKPMEIETLQEVLDDYHAGNIDLGHRALTMVIDGRTVGFAYHAPAAMTDRSWYLYWIAVEKTDQARGLGGRLLRAVEEDVVHSGGRVLFIETSSLPHYDPTRQFYLKHGYDLEATLHDYYAAGDHMVVFRKLLAG